MLKWSGVVTSSVLLWAGAATAQEFGNKGDAAFGAERLMGVHSDHVFRDNAVANNPGLDYNATSLGFGWFGHASVTPFDIPRLSFDYFIAEHWSLGGAIGYQSTSYSANNDRGAPDGSADLLFSPRVGYAHMFGRVVGIWPRAALTYHSETSNNNANINGFGLGLEAMFVFVPAQHFAILLGPSFDDDFTGRYEPNQGSNVDQGYRSLGLQAGILGWL